MVKSKAKDQKKESKKKESLMAKYRKNTAMGAVVLVIGVYFLAKDLGWLTKELSLIPIALVLGGLYLIIKNNQCACKI